LMDIAKIRLISQHIAASKFEAAKDLVDSMGAMQAQDFAMAQWAMGIRLPGATARAVEAAINSGEIIRTHLLRPTWQVVSANNLRWMLELTAPHIKASQKSRRQELGLSEALITKSNALIENALRDGKHLTREALVAELGKAKIATDSNRAYHLLVRAELDGIVCSGATQDKKPTYALLEERIPKTKPLTKEEALAALAKKYFTSRCPATLQDFAWWSGLPASEARHALEMVKPDFISETIDAQTYWFPNSFSFPKAGKESVYLLPAFDELLISYTDRRASLPLEDHNKAVSDNGIFRPIIVINGQVAGLWKRTFKKDAVIMETELFKEPGKTTRSLIEKAAVQFGRFLGKKTEINHKPVS
jgi:hypothetical protein